MKDFKNSKTKNHKKGFVWAFCLLSLISGTASCSSVKTVETVSTESSESVSDEAEEQKDIILTFAMSGYTDTIDKTIEEFNAADNGYQVQIKRYFDEFTEDGMVNVLSDEEIQYKDLEILQDITNHANVDIVCNASFCNEVYYDILKNKGAFADLYTFMENDSEVNTDTLDAHILKLNETDGKLCSVPTFYLINTLYGDAEYVGTKENWTFDDFLEHWSEMPEGSTLMGGKDKQSVFDVILRYNLNSFVDYENAQVHFDDPDFKRMLEFCDQFELKTSEKTIYDYDAPSMLSPLMAEAIMTAPIFDKDNGKTCVGYPSSDGNGAYLASYTFSYSICANSSPEKQQGAWEFIRTFLTEEWQIENAIPIMSGGGVFEDYYSTEMGLCVNKNAFDEIARRLINKEYFPTTYTDKGVEYDTRFPIEKEVKEMRRYIDSVDRWGTQVGAVGSIVYEETEAYFAGEKSIDECISLIHNRASIWISEQS